MSSTVGLTSRIEPGRSWLSLDLKDIWTYRELLYLLTWRDIKVRYKQTAIGVLWAVLQPALTTTVFAVLFSRVGRFDTPGVPYSDFVLSGILIWLFVFNAVTFASNSLVGNSTLVTKVYFPRLIVPLAATLSALVDLAPGFLMLIGLMLLHGTPLSIQIFFAPLFVALAVVMTLSLGCLFAALNVRFRDVKFALPFALQVWMFASPVFYPTNIVSERVGAVLALNPLTGILQGFRASMFGGPFDWPAIGTSVAMTVALLVLALFAFKQMEDDFADRI